MSATFSNCGLYRYELTRNLQTLTRWFRPVTFVMLNPSTANQWEDDPTIRRCIYFAEREGFTLLRVVNLFAFRATDPKELFHAKDPIGPGNDEFLADNNWNEPIVVAWGDHRLAATRARRFVELVGKKRQLVCLGTTKDGSPRHPLYLKKTTPIVEWKLPEGAP